MAEERIPSNMVENYPIINKYIYILLSHHPPNKLDHTIKIEFGMNSIYICARCLGLISGLFFSIAFAKYFNKIILISYPIIYVICLIPGTLDWIYHNLNKWKSNNIIRISTGFLLGIPIGIVISYTLYGKFLILAEFIMLSLGYLIVLLLLFSKLPLLGTHLQEYEEFLEKILYK